MRGDRVGWAPLHWAAENGQTDVAKALIAAGADLNAKDQFRCAPLHRAVRNGYIDVVQALLTAGADVNVRNLSEDTPLHKAVRSTWITKVLLTAGAIDENRESPSICMVALVNWCRNDGLISLCKLSLFTLALFVYALYLKIYGVPRELNDGL